jgi:hypothetical protein
MPDDLLKKLPKFCKINFGTAKVHSANVGEIDTLLPLFCLKMLTLIIFGFESRQADLFRFERILILL